MEILYISPVPFLPVLQGNVSTINQYIKRLNLLGHKVHFVLICDFFIELEYINEMYKFADSIDIIVPNPAEINRSQKDKNGYDVFDSKYMDGMGELIQSYTKKYNIDTVICTNVWYSKILEYVPDNVLKIIDTHDRMTDRHLFLKKNHLSLEFFSCTKEDEGKYLQRADVVWARGDEETKFFNEITNSNKAVTVPHFEPADFLNKKYGKLKKIGILASENKVNYKMVCDFVRKFNTAIKNKPIDIELIIAGNVKNIIYPPKKKLRNLSNLFYGLIGRKDKQKGESTKLFEKDYIKLIGAVDNINDFYNDIDLAIIPITFGTGIRVKMFEAMAKGVPVISTECGIKGMESESKYHHCSDIDELINKIYEVYNDENILNELSEKSKECYTKFYASAVKNFDMTFQMKEPVIH